MSSKNIRLREALNNLEIRHAFVVEENEELRKGELGLIVGLIIGVLVTPFALAVRVVLSEEETK